MEIGKLRKGYNVKLIAMMVGLGLAGGIAVAKEASAEMKVPAMDCAACTVVIKKALTQTKGVKNVDLNVDKRTATVVYEHTQVTHRAPSKHASATKHAIDPRERGAGGQQGSRRAAEAINSSALLPVYH